MYLLSRHTCNGVEDTRALKPQEVALYELNIYVSGDAKRIHDSFGWKTDLYTFKNSFSFIFFFMDFLLI